MIKHTEENDAKVFAEQSVAEGSSSRSFVTADAIRRSFDSILLENMPLVSFLVACLYLLFSIGHFFVLPSDIKPFMLTLSLGSVAIAMGMYFYLRKKKLESKWAHPVTVALAGLIYLNSVTHLILTGDPMQSTNLALLAIGAGCFFLSNYWLAMVIVLIIAGWLTAMVQIGPSQESIHYGFMLLGAVFISFIVHSLRMRVYMREINMMHRLNQAQYSLNHRTRELESATKDLKHEIAERKEVENQLRTLSLVASKTDNSVVITDKRGYIEWVNDGFTRITGYTLEEVKNKKPGTLLQGPKTDPKTVKRIRQQLASKKSFTEEILNYHKEGFTYWLSLSITPIIDDTGMLVRYIAIQSDITGKREAETALRESEERLRKILSNIVDGIIIFDVGGLIKSVNPAAQKIFDYREDQLVDQSIYSLIPKQNLHTERETESASFELSKLSNGSAVKEIEGVCSSGERITLDVAMSDMSHHGEKQYIAIVRDVTERKQAQAALMESEARFRGAFDNAATGMALVAPGGKFLKVNRSLSAILGYSEEELLTIDFQSITHGEDLEDDLGFVRQMLDNKITAYQMEKRYYHKNGYLIWSLLSVSLVRDMNGKPLYFVSQIQDITERKKSVNALKESEERLQAFLDEASDLIHTTDPFGNLKYANRAWQRALGYEPKEITKITIWDIIDPAYHSRYEDVLSSAFRGDSSQDVELVFKAKNGRRILVAGSTNCRFEEGSPVATRSIFRDVTERKRAAEELRKAKEAAEHANLTKSQFLANMSHELRTPLNSVIGFANILKKNKHNSLNDKDLNYIERIVSNGVHLLDLINDVLDLSKVEAGKVEVEPSLFDLNELISEIFTQLENQTQSHEVELICDSPKDLEPIESDRGKLKQVLINLIGNALKFTKKGNVTVKVHTAPDAKYPIQIDVIDTGIGIPQDRLESIFKAFQQADSSTTRKYGGTGLGLSISRSLCELMGYSLTVQSKENVGSTFSMHLRHKASAGENNTLGLLLTQQNRQHSDLKNKLVLIIDDESDARFLLAHHLEELGCETITAKDGEEGMRMARVHQPDLITTDLMMPGLHGWELLRQIKDDPELSHIPVVVISGVSKNEISAPLGAVDYLPKPFHPDALATVLNRNLVKVDRPGEILLIEDDTMEQLLIKEVLREEGYHIHICNNGVEALDMLEHFIPDLILVDLIMPEMDGFTFLKNLRLDRRFDKVPTVVITSKDINDDELIELQHSTTDILSKTSDFQNRLRSSLSNYF